MGVIRGQWSDEILVGRTLWCCLIGIDSLVHDLRHYCQLHYSVKEDLMAMCE